MIGRGILSVIALTGALLVPASASAQLNGVGVRLGLGHASMGGGYRDLVNDVGGKMEGRTGIVAGAFVDYGLPLLAGRLSVQAGAELTQKGMRIPPDGGLRERKLDVSYLDIPVVARAAFDAGQVRPYVIAGPVFSLRTSTRGEIDGEEVDTTDDVTGSDVGFAFGVGGQRDRFGIELRYVLGMSNVSESNDPDETAKNRQWSIVASYTLPLRR